MGALYHAEQIGWQIMRDVLNAVSSGNPKTTSQLAKHVESRLHKDLSKLRSRKDIRRTIYYMKSRGLLSYDDQQRVVLTERGAERLDELADLLSPIRLGDDESWDRKWRIVVFDIPESKRQARDALRRVIKKLGFVQLQRSVWVHPLPCKRYFDEICDAYGVHDDILYLETDEISVESTLKKHFRHLIRN